MPKIIDALLAPILDKFKASNPRLWLLILFVSTVVAYGAQQGEILGVFKIEGALKTAVLAVLWILAQLNGSRTTNILHGDTMSNLAYELEVAKTNLAELGKDYDSLNQHRQDLVSKNLELDNQNKALQMLIEVPAEAPKKRK